MIGQLPESLEIGGRHYKIRTDYRIVLGIFEAFNDSELTEEEKAEICLRNLFDVIPDNLSEALTAAFAFLDGKTPEVQDMSAGADKTKAKILDWKHDEQMIFAAVNRAAGFEVRTCKHLHWWTFLGFFSEMQEGLLSTVIRIRQKMADGKKLEDYEKEFLQKNRDLVIIRTAEDAEEIRKTRAFVDTLLSNGETAQ